MQFLSNYAIVNTAASNTSHDNALPMEKNATFAIRHKMNHFSSVCQSRSQQQVGSRLRQVRGINEAQYDSDDDENFLHISTIDANIKSPNDTKSPIIMIDGNGAKSTIMSKLDTGAEANVIFATVYDSLCLSPPR